MMRRKGIDSGMSRIKVYTSFCCPYCVRAVDLLKAKGAEIEEIDVTMSPDLRAQMRVAAGGCNKVPQIFIGEQHIGGYVELSKLDEAGDLDPLLAPKGFTE